MGMGICICIWLGMALACRPLPAKPQAFLAAWHASGSQGVLTDPSQHAMQGLDVLELQASINFYFQHHCNCGDPGPVLTDSTPSDGDRTACLQDRLSCNSLLIQTKSSLCCLHRRSRLPEF